MKGQVLHCMRTHFKVQNWSSVLITRKITHVHSGCQKIACVASVSNWVTAQKLEREQKKWKGEGVGRKGKRLLANPTILENVPWNFMVRFIRKLTAHQPDRERTDYQITKFTFFPKTRSTRLQNCNKKKLYDKRRLKLKVEGWRLKRLLRNFLFFIVKWNFQSSVAFSQLKPCQNIAKKLFVRKNSLRRLWVLQSGCSP